MLLFKVFLFSSACVWGYAVGSNNVFSQHSSLLPLVTLGEKTYYFGVYFEASYDQALLFCQHIKMRLVSITSEEENSRLLKYMLDNSLEDGFWTSATKAIDGKNWVWLPTGEKIEYFNWEDGQPEKKDEFCIQILNSTDGLVWSDYPCTDNFHFICENVDSQGPIARQTEPTEVSLHNSDIPETSVVGKKYRVSKIRASADDASRMCKKYGMELVNIRNKEENDIITKLIHKFVDYKSLVPYQNSYYWTSARKQSDETWVWADGQQFDYTNWDEPEPNNLVPPEDCMHVYVDGKWNDIGCERVLHFICEAPESPKNLKRYQNLISPESPKTDSKHTCNSQPIVNVYVNSKPDVDTASFNEVSQVDAIKTESSPFN